eukprot:COSAG02_NODE_9586_length_2168_cov_2.028019_2_plen_30_part_00
MEDPTGGPLERGSVLVSKLSQAGLDSLRQ